MTKLDFKIVPIDEKRLEQLVKRGMHDDLYEQLRAMGPKSMITIKTNGKDLAPTIQSILTHAKNRFKKKFALRRDGDEILIVIAKK